MIQGNVTPAKAEVRSEKEQDIPVGEIGQLDPKEQAKAFTDGLLSRRFKDGFRYKLFERSEYGDILRGETTQSTLDLEGIGRTRRAVSAIRRSL